MARRRLEYAALGSLEPATNNPKGHALAALGESFGRFGYIEPMVRDERTGRLVVGHGRREELLALKAAGKAPPEGVEVDEATGEWLVPVLAGWSSKTDDEAAAFLLAANKLTEAGGWSRQAYEDLVASLEQRGARLESLGWGRAELDDILAAVEQRKGGATPAPVPSLRDRFLVPPFSILDARQGYWKERKAAWLAIGIRSEVGRGDNLIGRSLYDIAAAGMPGTYDEKKRFVDGLKAQGKTDAEIIQAIADAGGRARPAFPRTGAVMPAGQGGMADGLVAKREASKRRVAAPGKGQDLLKSGAVGDRDFGAKGKLKTVAASFGQDLMRDKGAIPCDGLGPGKRRKADARTFATGAQLGAGNFNDQVVGKRGAARAITDHEWVREKQADGDLGDGLAAGQSGTSIFDPVLCELAYRWFVPPGGRVLDPFAGGSVRGVVASLLGLSYTGIELRSEQVAANAVQGRELCAKAKTSPRWICGDSRDMVDLLAGDAQCLVDAKGGGMFDFVFSCPPYADLERYSDDPRDLSTLDYTAFLAAYRQIINLAVHGLRADRFAMFVVGDIRAPDGTYRNFPADTIAAFRDAGAALYNEAILVTAIGSLPIRVGKQFVTTRKLGKTHQQCLIFVKGDARRATEACGEVEVEFPADLVVADAEASSSKYGEELP